MKQLIEKYLKVISEDKNYFGYDINEHTFKPFEYKNVFCAAANICKSDLNHVLNRLNQRTKATINDVFIVLKRGIDKFLELKNSKYKDRRTKSFHIISKSYPEFKLAIQIVRNDQKDIFRYIENNDEFFFNCSYICFLYTILKNNMEKKPLDDELFVESNTDSTIKTKIINLYVD